MSRPSGLAADQITFEDFCALVGDGRKAELIDGAIYIAPPDLYRTNRITGFVLSLVSMFVEVRGIGGDVFLDRFAFRLSEICSLEPDVAYVASQRLHLLKEEFMQGGPDIAVEVVSRDSRNRDYGEKRQMYEDAGVSEYWIIDPLQQRVEFLRLRDGRYELVPLENNRIFRSEVIPGFWIDADWLLAEPLPPLYPCLQEVVGGAGADD